MAKRMEIGRKMKTEAEPRYSSPIASPRPPEHRKESIALPAIFHFGCKIILFYY